jgi:adenosylcobinamide hydrolase
MKQFDLVGEGNRLLFKDNILAVLSDSQLSVVSSAFHNGGVKETKVIINAQVPQNYNDHSLHQDPEQFIQQCFGKLELEGFADGFVGTITFAVVEAFSLVSLCKGDLGVSVVATGGCTHAESAGEQNQPQPAAGTINVIVLIDGNPTEACMVSSIITATEAKTAALKELDVRSLYTGKAATGTPTDAIVVAKTGRGEEIVYSGPASELGQLIACCAKQAVKEAVAKAPIGGYPLGRSIEKRFAERHLDIAKLAFELAKVKSLDQDEKTIAAELNRLLKENVVLASALFAAADLSREFEEGRLPREMDAVTLGTRFGELLSKKNSNNKNSQTEDCEEVDLPVFLKHALIALLKNGF